jgi:hypothetical protein
MRSRMILLLADGVAYQKIRDLVDCRLNESPWAGYLRSIASTLASSKVCQRQSVWLPAGAGLADDGDGLAEMARTI